METCIPPGGGVIFNQKISRQISKRKNNASQNHSKSVFEHLTKRELEICDLMAKGNSNRQIGMCLQNNISEGTVKNHVSLIFKKTGIESRVELVAKYISENKPPAADTADSSSETVITTDIQPAAALRLISGRNLPDLIPLKFKEQTYTIGRVDVNIGLKQCDFEFDPGTKAVSRRHAAFKMSPTGFTVIDLNSRAGTFVNRNRIKPGMQYFIHNGDQISFGNAGADYIFEC